MHGKETLAQESLRRMLGARVVAPCNIELISDEGNDHRVTRHSNVRAASSPVPRVRNAGIRQHSRAQESASASVCDHCNPLSEDELCTGGPYRMGEGLNRSR